MLLRKGIEVVITALTRNQVCGNASRVRIPLFPPIKTQIDYVCFDLGFSFAKNQVLPAFFGCWYI